MVKPGIGLKTGQDTFSFFMLFKQVAFSITFCDNINPNFLRVSVDAKTHLALKGVVCWQS